MVTRNDIIHESQRLGFCDVGFTTAEHFDSHRTFLKERREEYGWTESVGLDLMNGTNPKAILPSAKSIVVLLENYFCGSFPASLERHFGRCYLDDDRVTKDGLSARIKAFRTFLQKSGMDSKVPFNLPHRVAAARAGLGTFGKNCLFYAGRTARKSSWVLPITLVVDQEFEYDEPTMKMDCPDWCRNACISACPTRALKGNGTIDPRKCISFLTYFGRKITPLNLREPMGLCVYGCDRCQNVCPRNIPWSDQDLPMNERAAAKSKHFDLSNLLHMDKTYFDNAIWPHMFYMSSDDIWKWKMNVARVMGNSLNDRYTTDLVKAFNDNSDERLKGMIAWALGRIGGTAARKALHGFLQNSDGLVRAEIIMALDACS